MKRLCQFKDALGKPREGVHSVRVLDIPILDVLGTLLGAWLLSRLTGIGFGITSIFLFALGFFLHWLFCVETPLTKLFFD